MSAASATIDSLDATHRRELYFFTLYRCFQAALLALLVFSPFGGDVIDLYAPVLARSVAAAYLVVAVLALLAGRRPDWPMAPQVMLALAADIAVALLIKHAVGGIEGGVSLLLAVNIGAAAVILTLRTGMGLALIAAAGTVGENLIAQFGPQADERNLAQAVMYAITYLATAVLCNLLGRQMAESAALADRRGQELANMAQLNELIIRRMRTGVMVVDGRDQVRLVNEAAWHLLGEPSPNERHLERISPALSQRLRRWKLDPHPDAEPMVLADDRPAVIPRFTSLTVIDELHLVFLDDSSLVSRRAEELTLSTLGRLSASIAHEIRNPLAAIQHAAQLLQESPELASSDQRLVEIVLNHCGRMNGIIENVLGLSRRERSRPEQVDLAHWVHHFVGEYKAGHFLNRDELGAVSQHRHLYAMADPQQLHQVVSALVQNALAYGKLPGEPARVTVIARQSSESSPPLIEVIDRGPGIPERIVTGIFEPFYTTSEYGSGLGLYIAKQLCEANQAMLEYVALAGSGSCFRISLPVPRGLEAPHKSMPAPARAPVPARPSYT